MSQEDGRSFALNIKQIGKSKVHICRHNLSPALWWEKQYQSPAVIPFIVMRKATSASPTEAISAENKQARQPARETACEQAEEACPKGMGKQTLLKSILTLSLSVLSMGCLHMWGDNRCGREVKRYCYFCEQSVWELPAVEEILKKRQKSTQVDPQREGLHRESR